LLQISMLLHAGIMFGGNEAPPRYYHKNDHSLLHTYMALAEL